MRVTNSIWWNEKGLTGVAGVSFWGLTGYFHMNSVLVKLDFYLRLTWLATIWFLTLAQSYVKLWELVNEHFGAMVQAWRTCPLSSQYPVMATVATFWRVLIWRFWKLVLFHPCLLPVQRRVMVFPSRGIVALRLSVPPCIYIEHIKSILMLF